MNSFLNRLCQELVLSTTHLFAECFFRFKICCIVTLTSTFSSSFSPFLLFWGICNTYPRLSSSCSSGSELYALSRHKCCSLLLFLLPVLGLDDGDGLLITMLSTTFVTSLMSWVLAEEITADSGMPFLSVRMCLFVPSLLLSVGLFPGHRPPKGDFMDMLSMDCHVQLIPTTSS